MLHEGEGTAHALGLRVHQSTPIDLDWVLASDLLLLNGVLLLLDKAEGLEPHT